MICCEECFSDKEIQNIIISYNQKGKCDFCDSTNSSTCETDVLAKLFERLLEIYIPVSSSKNPPDKKHQFLLIDNLENNWNIFSRKIINKNLSKKLITSICSKKNSENPELFNSLVIIPEASDAKYLLKHSILKNSNWGDFVNEIKYENRFFIKNKMNLNVFERLFKYFTTTYPPGEPENQEKQYFRVRITKADVPFKISEMGAPPKEKRISGRVNPKGISVLYLSNSRDTAISELRPTFFDNITVGTFDRDGIVEVLNFCKLDSISPFVFKDITEYAINKENLSNIGREVSKPISRRDSDLDYLPTQYLSEYIKSIGFDGIEYASSVDTKGHNLAIFNQNKFHCSTTTLLNITKVTYSFKVIKNESLDNNSS